MREIRTLGLMRRGLETGYGGAIGALPKETASNASPRRYQSMKEPYEKGIANHSAPSFAVCAVRRTSKRNRGTGGLGIELRKRTIRTPTLSTKWKAIWRGTLMRVPRQSCVVGDPMHVWKLHAREPGDLGDA